MINKADKNKSEYLGIPYGTACNRLRKQLLFSFVLKLGLDTCFKCKKKILTLREFSIEHKVPWYNKNKELFWDLNNIAFSHLRCNKTVRVATYFENKSIRKVKRPSYIKLSKELKQLGSKKVSKKYKVERSTIRNWIKMYRKQLNELGKTLD